MTGQDQHLLHIWLITNGGDGELFLSDIERMLTSLARSSGGVLTAAARSETVASSELWFAVTPADLGQRLTNELGVHRALLVPRDSQNGRICTSAVGVELLSPTAEPSAGKPDAPVLKTYNYQQGRVTRHATGERLSLDAVLSGQA